MTITTVVTGSASGIGAATRNTLEAAGHEVIGVDLKNAEISGDLSTDTGRAAVIKQVLTRCDGKLDALVLCAGLGVQVSPASLIAEVNYFGVVQLLDGLLPALSKGTRPAAVVISSTASSQIGWEQNPLATAFEAGDHAKLAEILGGAGERAGFIAYSGSKNAVTVAVRRRVRAWGKAGVRLNTVAPGSTQTPLFKAALDDPRYGEAVRNYVAPIGRVAQPQEIASAVAFLLGPGASYVHGTQLFVDGGIDAEGRPTRF